MNRLLRILCAGILWLGFGGCWAQQPQRYTFERGLMGTSFRLVFYAPNDSIAQKAAEATFLRIEHLNTQLSDYLDGSEINRLSASSGSGQWVDVSPDLFRILVISKAISKKTNGHFDVTVGPYVQEWRRALRRNYFPDAKRLRALRKKVGYKHLRLATNRQAVQLRRPGMKLDVGGIGKGYAADEALLVLRTHGINAALVDAGGDLALGDPPPMRSGWEVAVPSYSDQDTTSQVRILSNVAIATSGAAYRYLEHEGKRYSHIVSPRTGVGLLHHVRTTVIAPNGTLADALATAVSVAGATQTERFARNFRDIKISLAEQRDNRMIYWQSGR